MNLNSFREEFLILYDKVTNFSAPGYEDEEIALLLTKAQERIVLSSYSENGNKYGEGFEETEKRRKQLQQLVVPNVTLVASSNQDGVEGKAFDLPLDCFFVIKEHAKINGCACCNNKFKRVKPVTHDEVESNRDNPFKKPSEDLLWRLDINGKRHDLITKEGTSVQEYRITYLKKPRPIVFAGVTIDGVTGPSECELNEVTHRMIIDEAVKIATGITDPQLYQIKTAERQQSE